MSEVQTDDFARERAADPQRSILLQAPAGSGKTTVLTQRLLRLLAVVEQPEEILAITFTRKAAAEMRARVLAALRGTIDAAGAEADQLRRWAAAALGRSAALGWNLEDNPGRLRIQTIDSFNFWLASQLPVAARVGGSLQVADRPQESYQRAARATLIAGDADAALAGDFELLFERLDNSWGRVERLLADMLRRRGHWLRYVLAHDGDALRARIAQSLHDIVSDHLLAACERVSPALRALAQRVHEIGALGTDPACLPGWQRLASVALTLKGEWRKARGINKSMGSGYEDLAAQKALRDCIENWKASEGALQSLRELASLPAVLTEADAAAIAALARVLRFAAAQLQAEFALAGRVDHTYVAGAAREALTEGGYPTDLALRTGLALRHILVDEFQDTSIGQFELLEALTAAWEEGDGRTLFIVGDPMQSIYQFREAEVGLFLRARDRGIGPVRLEALRLTRNFRSQARLIAWSNDTFAQLFPAQDELRSSAVAFTHSLPARPDLNDAAVEARLFAAGDIDSEAIALATRIGQLRRADPLATAAVLVAARSHAVPVMAALQVAGIDAVGVDLIPLGELSIVRDLAALTRALHHLGDRTAWLTVLRAPWCGVSLATLSELSRREDPLLLWEALSSDERLRRCDAVERERLLRIREVLAVGLGARDRLPLVEWLQGVWMRLGAMDAYSSGELLHARAFFEALRARVTSGEWRGPQDIHALSAELYAKPQASLANPVQIMTIHRAKGLEFDHVFIPGLDRELNRGAEPLLRWFDLPRHEGASDLIMAPVPSIGDEEGGQLGAYLKRLAAVRAAHERARLLYVAVTRARKTLHLSAAPVARADGSIAPRSGTLLACLWPALAGQFKSAASESAAVPLTAAVQVLHRLPAHWHAVALPAAPEWSGLPIVQQSLGPVEFSWAGETVRLIGTVVHAAFEQFAARAALPSQEAIQASRALYGQQLQRLGVPEGELEGATAVVMEALSRTLADERGRWLFAPEHRQAHSELAVTGIAAGRLIRVAIDRSFVDAHGTRWVIDFKTSRHEGADLEVFLDREVDRYRAQLQGYVALAGALGPEPVRAGLYFPLLGAFREVT